ncbi:MAG: hypothetical protein ABR587_04695 [Candidatus Binatia bacterium]
MPVHRLILAAALAVASPSFAEDSAPTGDALASAEQVLPPKIMNVPAAHDHAPARGTADRSLLLREFPDDLVESMWLQDWTDLERAHQFGRLVDVVSDPEGRGIVLRLEGGSRIGELEDDAYKQMLLCRLTKPAAGLLYRIASRMRLIEGEEYVPLEITSLVRTWDYQLRLTDVNPNADRTREGVPPTHVLGLAFDIARTSMSQERQQRLEFLFDQLARDGELAYYKEGSSNGLMHYHVIALPSAETMLARHYDRESQVAERREENGPRQRYLPDSPCVTFGYSLEPYSAICSCELPLEVSASAYFADAPVSR